MPKQPMSTTDLTIEYVSLDTLKKWPTNPKQHDVGAIAASVEKHGFRDPLAINKRNNEIEEGHGRLDTLAAMRKQSMPAPAFIRVEHGEWHVPVIWFDDDELTQHSYALAHNRTQDLGGGYDDALLLDALKEQAAAGLMLGTGFDDDDFEALCKKVEGEHAGDQTEQLSTQFQVLVDCATETQQAELLERFLSEGLSAKALIS